MATRVIGSNTTKTLKINGFAFFKVANDELRMRYVTGAQINITSETLETFITDDGMPVAGRTTDEIGDFEIDYKQSIEWWPDRDISAIAEDDLSEEELMTLSYWQNKIAVGDWPEIDFIQAFVAENFNEPNKVARSGYVLRIKNITTKRDQSTATEDGIITGTVINLNDSIRESELPFATTNTP